jgi:hypothetical protein
VSNSFKACACNSFLQDGQIHVLQQHHNFCGGQSDGLRNNAGGLSGSDQTKGMRKTRDPGFWVQHYKLSRNTLTGRQLIRKKMEATDRLHSPDSSVRHKDEMIDATRAEDQAERPGLTLDY